MDTIAARIAATQERVAAAARRSGRAPDAVRLVGVTKTHPPELVAEALAAGLGDQNITANVVLPSTIDTPGNRKHDPTAGDGRWVQPEAIAAV
ncbi:hypothetical protein SE17_40280, partial [Kouleothrix aurantiaca]